MNPTPGPIRQLLLSFILANSPMVFFGQDSLSLNCGDVRNGTFYYYNPRDNNRETFVRKGNLQRETDPLRKETVFWEVNWLNDCTYTLKYQSGAENHPAAQQKILNKHLIVIEILQVTEDYMTFRTALDKMTNTTILSDTLWIRQRQSLTNKTTVSNPRVDAILTERMRKRGSLLATYATLYVYWPGRFADALMNYDLLINGEKACTINNGCRQILKLKPGSFHISAKLYGTEQSVTINAKSGDVYYLQCLCIWGVMSKPALQLMNNKDGETAFKTPEKENLLRKE